MIGRASAKRTNTRSRESYSMASGIAGIIRIPN